MEVFYKNSQPNITVNWTITRGQTPVKENFSYADVYVFLLTNEGKKPLSVIINDGVITFSIPAGLDLGVYGVKCIWFKDPNRNTKPCVSEILSLFGITSDTTEATTTKGVITLNVKSSVATYGYDGLSAYESARVLGFADMVSEKEWLDGMDGINSKLKKVNDILTRVEYIYGDMYSKSQIDEKIGKMYSNSQIDDKFNEQRDHIDDVTNDMISMQEQLNTVDGTLNSEIIAVREALDELKGEGIDVTKQAAILAFVESATAKLENVSVLSDGTIVVGKKLNANEGINIATNKEIVRDGQNLISTLLGYGTDLGNTVSESEIDELFETIYYGDTQSLGDL